MTLTQFASQHVASDDNALTLVFSPGEHTLSQTIHISDLKNLTLIGESKQLCVISYISTIAMFELTNISNILFIANLNMSRNGQTVLSISNVKSVYLKECYIMATQDSRTAQTNPAVAIHSILHVTIYKTNFEHNGIFRLPVTSPPLNYVTGSAIIIINSYSVFFIGSSFTSNYIRVVTNSSSQAVSAGGAVYLADVGIAILNNCTMKNNTILCYGCQYVLGGAIALYNANQLSVTNSTLILKEMKFCRTFCLFLRVHIYLLEELFMLKKGIKRKTQARRQ